MLRTRLVLTALGLGLTLLACDDQGTKVGDDTNPSSTDDSGEVEDTTPPIPENETDCEDGIDEDQDGVTDCEDSDCADVFRCTWPESLGHNTHAFFDGMEIECRAIGIPFDVDVPDCTTDLVAPLQEFTEGNICTSCDKSYVGPVNVTDDSCAELLGDNAEPSPTELAFGFQFVSTQERVLWARDEAGVWAQAVTMTREGEGPWQWSSTSEIWDDPPDCNNGQQHLGDLTVTLTFTDP
ncbi:MAG: hypothetical protein H6741_18365 [Alphaproteobacteria bacterium]|nr:hypothetical protein [Alphaproteobacteria bacterium]MCB9794681.1 hypothetical protein [Alphaproteobacteria bacterium]